MNRLAFSRFFFCVFLLAFLVAPVELRAQSAQTSGQTSGQTPGQTSGQDAQPGGQEVDESLGYNPLLTPEQASELIRDTPDLLILDVRNFNEYIIKHFPGALLIPEKELEKRVAEIPTGRPVLVHCSKGVRSMRAYKLLRQIRPDLTELYTLIGSPDFGKPF
ncbi:rhodanese-like domain-containing protein [Desulfovibrio sp. OttesenSCG-928-C14]|nr:rhodanese-like domain-containing protein [Desulfovibrio sp. OttesenSCG-928-C14]